MDLVILACASGVTVDSQTNQASIFGLLEEVRPVGFPAAMQVFLMAQFRKTPKESSSQNVQLTIALEREVIFQTPLTIDFQDKLRARLVANLAGLVVTKPGLLSFKITQKKKQFGAWLVEIHPPESAQLTLQGSEKEKAPRKAVRPKGKKAAAKRRRR